MRWDSVYKCYTHNRESIYKDKSLSSKLESMIQGSQVLILRAINQIASMTDIVKPLQVAGGDTLTISAFIFGLSAFAINDNLSMLDTVNEITNRVGDGITEYNQDEVKQLVNNMIRKFMPLFGNLLSEYSLISVQINNSGFIEKLYKMFFAGILLGYSINESINLKDQELPTWLDTFYDYCTELYNNATRQDAV